MKLAYYISNMIIAVAIVSLFVILSSMAISFDIPTSIYEVSIIAYTTHTIKPTLHCFIAKLG